jgi:hypothetical protein
MDRAMTKDVIRHNILCDLRTNWNSDIQKVKIKFGWMKFLILSMILFC